MLPISQGFIYEKTPKYSHRQFSDYLANESVGKTFLQPTDFLFLLKNEILTQLTDSCNLSFKTGIFPLVLKTAKEALLFKKD